MNATVDFCSTRMTLSFISERLGVLLCQDPVSQHQHREWVKMSRSKMFYHGFPSQNYYRTRLQSCLKCYNNLALVACSSTLPHSRCHRLLRCSNGSNHCLRRDDENEESLVSPVDSRSTRDDVWSWRCIMSDCIVVVNIGSENDGCIGECKRYFPFGQLRMSQRN